MTDSIDDVLKRAISPRSVTEHGTLTQPRSYGVYALPHTAGATKRHRFGNHPVRMRELESEFGSCKLEYLFADRRDAMLVATTLSGTSLTRRPSGPLRGR
jgi:hypothetical protein